MVACTLVFPITQFFLFSFIYLKGGEGVRTVSERQREEESVAPGVGLSSPGEKLEIKNHSIVTRAEAGCLTD